MTTWSGRSSFGLLAAAAVIWLSGCLSATYSALVRYDETKDEFTVLNVYQRITAAMPRDSTALNAYQRITYSPGDSEYLYQLWRNRDHLIRMPNFDVFGMPAVSRLSSRRYADIDLAKAPEVLEPTESAVALDAIRVLPGTFVLPDADTLCYYDQVVLPGTVIDQKLFAKSPAPEWTAAIDKELTRRREGGKRVAWDDIRPRILEEVHSASNPGAGAAIQAAGENSGPPDLLHTLDQESLKLLRKGVSDGTMKVTREKQVFRLILPLSDADAHQVTETWHAVADTIKADASKADANSATFASIASRLQPALALSTGPGGIELRIDLAIILVQLPAIANVAKPLDASSPEALTRMRDTIAALRAHGVPIDQKVTVEQIVKGFFAGSLESYPSAHPVEPGSGLVQPRRK